MESVSRPLHRRKLSNANGFSFSAKQHPYDGVLTGSQPKFGAPVLPSGAPDYSEIFGVSRGSSIPVLDLSALEDDATVTDDGGSSDKLDYSNIFGGFSEEDIGVPYEELFSRGKRGKRSSAKSRTASEGSDQFSPSGRQKESSCDTTNQSLDGPKHFNLSYHKTSQRSRDGSNGMTQIAQLHAVPGFTHFIDESSHLPKAKSCEQAPFVESDVLRHRSFSGEIFKGHDGKGDLHVPKIQSSDGVHRNRSFSGEIFKEGHARNGDLHVPKRQSSDGAHRNRSFSGDIFKEGHARNGDWHAPKIQDSDGVYRNRSFSGEIFKEGHVRSGDLHVPKIQNLDGVHRNRSFSGEIFKEGHARNGDLHVSKKQSSDGHQNRRVSGEIFREGPDRNVDLHVPKKQSSDDVHHDRSFSGESFNGHDRKGNLHVPKKQSSVGVVKVTSGSWDAFNDKFFSAHDEFDRRSSSIEGASTSSPMANDIKGQPYQSKISGPDSKFGASGRGIRANDTSPHSSDEELDANSAAAISAATLKKAIEKAQESIRLAKELMESKNDGVPASLKRRSKGSLKSKDNRVERNTRSTRGNTIELQRKLGVGLPPLAEVCRGIPSSNADFASCFNLKEQQRVTGNVEASHRDVAGILFPEVISSRKESTQTLVSQQVESRNHSQPSIENNRHGYKLKEMNTSNKTKEFGEAPDNSQSMGHIMRTPNVLGKAEAPEQYKGTSNSALMHDSEENVNSDMTKEYCFSKEKGNCSAELKKSENMKNNLESTFVEQWSFKNLQNSLAPFTEEKIEFQEMENDNLHNSRKTPPGNETLYPEDLECTTVPKKLEKVEMEENKGTLRRSSGEEETDIVHKEAFLWVENDEKPQHGCEKEGIESRQEDFQGGQENGISYGVRESEPSENKTTYSCEGEESERKQEGSEREVPQNISVEPCQYKATEELGNQTDKFAQNKKTEASQEADKIDSGLEASDKSEEYQETSVAPGVADKQNLKKAVDEPDHKCSTCSSEIQEACVYQLENGGLEIIQQAVDFEEVQGVSEAINEHTDCEKDGESEESSSHSRAKEILETASDLQNASEEDTSEGVVQDIYESSSEDAKEVNRGSTCMNSADNLPSKRVLFETESFCTVIPENISDNDSHFVPEILPSEEQKNTTFIDINLEQKCMDETGRELEESSNPDEGDDSCIHGHVENEETIKGDGIVDQVEKNKDVEAAQQVKKSVEISEDLECSSLPGDREIMGNAEEFKAELQEEEKNLGEKVVVEEETKESLTKEVEDKNNGRKTEVDLRQQREREKDRIAVERAIREARERAFAEARERAERAAVERATAGVRQRVMAEAREKREKASASIKVSTDKTSIEAKLKAERAAVERATAEARERALEKALSQKGITELRSQVDRDSVERFASTTRENGLKHSFSSSDLEKFDGSNSESAQRRKARLERHQRIMERAAKALEEKNQRDLKAQKEQTERNRLAEALDSDIKRWASGKEGNLRALLSTLQYILGPNSGWQPISLTEIITTAAVKKAYRRATLYVHPDKLQQRGASIQQKYICEKVFDLLKAAWNRFNSEER